MSSPDVLPCFESPGDAPGRRSSKQKRTSGKHRLRGKPTQTQSSSHSDAQRKKEQQFIRLLLEREPSAWKQFLSRYNKLIISRVISTCNELAIIPRAELVEDCGAEVLAALFQNNMNGLRQFQSRSKLSTWLAVIVRRTTIKFLQRDNRNSENRKANDSQFDLATIPDQQSQNPNQQSQNNDTADQQHKHLRECMKKLKKNDRLALVLHFDKRLSYAKIGERLGISENAVGPKLHRAQKRLKKLIEAGNAES